MPLAEIDIDALGEIVNIGVGRAAASLSDLLGERIELQVPSMRMMTKADAKCDGPSGMSILQEFKGQVSGNALLVFPSESAKTLAKMLAGYDDSEDVQSLELSGILSEVGNIVLNGVLGSLGNVLGCPLEYRVPDFFVDETLASLLSRDANGDLATSEVLVADTNFHVLSRQIKGTVLIAFKLGTMENLCEHLLRLGTN
ncbi:MAG: chemotaxis protein CheX [Planctomycetales bacterium]|nr:chemotaxis protein CheX [Planctomycetales bacterium]